MVFRGQSPKPQLDSNRPKSPPLLCLLVRYSAHVMSCDVTLANCISCIIKHLIGTWKKSPPAAKQGKILRLDLSISCNFQQLWFSWQKSSPPPAATQGKILRLDLSLSCNFQQLWFSWQKSALPFSAFYWETQLALHMWNTHGPHTINQNSDSSYLNIFFRLQTLSTFQNTHI